MNKKWTIKRIAVIGIIENDASYRTFVDKYEWIASNGKYYVSGASFNKVLQGIQDKIYL